MNPYTIIFLSSLVLAFCLAVSYWKPIWERSKVLTKKLVSLFFIEIPQNHMVCVVINDVFVHFMANASDVEQIKRHLQFVPDSEKRKGKVATQIDQIITRDAHHFWSLFVKLANLHFKHWNPWTSLKKITVIKTAINTGYDSNQPLSEEILLKGENDGVLQTEYLRIQFPRVGFANDVVLLNNAKVDMVWSLLGVGIWDPYQIFFVNPDISNQVDYQTRQALGAYLGSLAYEEFKHEMGSRGFNANAGNHFNQYLLGRNADGTPNHDNAGIYPAGFVLTDPASIVDWRLDESQEALAKAEVERAASIVSLETSKNRAEARKVGIVKEGEGEAEVIRLKGAAEAEAARRLVKAYGKDGAIHAAHIEGRKALSSATTVVLTEPGRQPTTSLDIPIDNTKGNDGEKPKPEKPEPKPEQTEDEQSSDNPTTT